MIPGGVRSRPGSPGVRRTRKEAQAIPEPVPEPGGIRCGPAGLPFTTCAGPSIAPPPGGRSPRQARRTATASAPRIQETVGGLSGCLPAPEAGRWLDDPGMHVRCVEVTSSEAKTDGARSLRKILTGGIRRNVVKGSAGKIISMYAGSDQQDYQRQGAARNPCSFA